MANYGLKWIFHGNSQVPRLIKSDLDLISQSLLCWRILPRGDTVKNLGATLSFYGLKELKNGQVYGC